MATFTSREAMLKQTRHGLWRNAHSGIGHIDLGYKRSLAPCGRNAYGNALFARVVFNNGVFSVGDQVYQDLKNLMLIDDDVWKFFE